MENIKKFYPALGALLCVIFAVCSIALVTPRFTEKDAFAQTKASIDDKKVTVMELAAASTAASAAITLLPGDTATPIAEKLMDLSGYFLIILTALYLEKFLITIIGYISFSLLLPLGFVCLAAFILLKKDILAYWAKKLILLGILLFLVIPISVKTSDLINEAYGDSIQATIDAARDVSMEAENQTDTSEDAAQEESVETEEKSGFLSGLFSGVKETVKDGIETVKQGTTDISEKVKGMVNQFLEAIAVMIVTSCIIPILILFFFVWIIKFFLGVDIPTIKFSNTEKQ